MPFCSTTSDTLSVTNLSVLAQKMPKTREMNKHTKKNQHGQTMGQKGHVTRQRIMDATAALLDQKPFRSLKVAEIARAAGTSASTFYLYFESVEDLVLLLVRQTKQTTPEIMTILGRAWEGKAAVNDAQMFIREYVSFWEKHRSILLVRNSEADLGNKAFVEERMRSAIPILEALSSKVAAAKRKGIISKKLHAKSAAGVILAALERLAAVAPTSSSDSKITSETLIDAQARMLANLVSGESD